MQTTNFSLEELLRRAREKNLRIPRFRRAFVWKESQVEILIDFDVAILSHRIVAFS